MKIFAIVLLALIAGCHGAMLDATTMVNASAVYGSTATFTCAVSGTQAAFENLIFTKLNPDGVTTTTLSQDSTAGNTTKHSVSGTYSLNINDVVWTDEGQYTCSLSGVGSATAYLTVGIASTEGWIYWGDNSTWTQKDQKANLTCEASTARPPATFRWYRGNTQVTTGIINPTSTTDNNGYGTAVSMIEMTPTATDEGTNYTCYVDAAGTPGVNVITKTLAVAFSGAGSVMASVTFIMAALLASLHM